jgi:hypothetical protein
MRAMTSAVVSLPIAAELISLVTGWRLARSYFRN